MKHSLRHPIRERFLSKAALGLDLLLWLFWLPVILRSYTIPALLKRLSGGTEYRNKPVLELQAAARIVMRICNLRPFRSRIFPKQCLRQSLTLYRTLTRMGYPVEIHFGVLKDETNLRGHSWVTIAGEPVADTARRGIFKVVYSYCSVRSPLVASDRKEVASAKNVAVLNET
jgi:hypothetical protein